MPGRIIHAWVSSETEKRKTLVNTSEKGRAKDTKGQLISKGLFRPFNLHPDFSRVPPRPDIF